MDAVYIPDNYLQHHGILGQKWGVRRYQNEDGTLTEEGRKRYYSDLKAYKKDRSSKYKYHKHVSDITIDRQNKDIKELKTVYRKNGDYVIKKNTKLYRTATDDDEKRSEPKYFSLTPNDIWTYYETAGVLPSINPDPQQEDRYGVPENARFYEFEAKNKMIVASGKKVVDDFINKYGDTTIKSYYEDVNKAHELWYFNSTERGGFDDTRTLRIGPSDNKEHELYWERRYYTKGKAAVMEFIKENFNKHIDDISAQYINDGYDAIVDIEDRYSGLSSLPIIILNSDEIKQTKKRTADEQYDEVLKPLSKHMKHSSGGEDMDCVYISEPSSLYHHGILGQKWGVRRYQNEDGTLTEEGRKRYGLRYETAIPKGSILYRTTSSKDESTSGEKYVTYFQSDRNFYRGQGANWIAGVQGKLYGELYEKQYVLKDDLKMPDRNEMIEVYKKVAKSSAKKREMAGQARVDMILRSYGFGEIQVDEISNAYYNRATKDGKALIEALKKDPQKWDNYDYYAQMVEGQVKALKESSNLSDEFFLYTTGFGSNMGKKLKAEFIDELKKRGYNAMTDEAGVGGHAGYTREARQTLILFDGDELLDTKSTSRLNGYTYAKAKKEYTKWKKDLLYAEKKGFEHSSTGGESMDVVYIPSDYLMHWKYIERYKRRGKWRYVYADDSVHGSINRHMKEFERERNLADHEYEMADAYAKTSNDEMWRKHTKSAELFNRWAYEDYDEAETLVERYSISTHLMNVKYDVISAGKSAIDSILNLFKHSDSSDLYLEHHGILGQKWGVRRYQNTDGTLTPLGKKRRGSIRDYSDDELRSEIERSKLEKEYNREVGYGSKYYKGKTFKNPFTKKTVTSFASDQELEAYVNRRYLEMKVAEADAREVEQGLNYINNIMRTAGNVISTASSATKLISDIDKFVSGRKDKDDERKNKKEESERRKSLYDSTEKLSTADIKTNTEREKARWDYVNAVSGGGSGSNTKSNKSNNSNKRSIFKVERKKK